MKSTATRVNASGWHKGMRSLVRLAAMIAAIRAMPSTSPFFALPDVMMARVSGFIRMTPLAMAMRCVSAFPPTSTMWACPPSSKWVKPPLRSVDGVGLFAVVMAEGW